jgi:hypothetical protein
MTEGASFTTLVSSVHKQGPLYSLGIHRSREKKNIRKMPYYIHIETQLLETNHPR